MNKIKVIVNLRNLKNLQELWITSNKIENFKDFEEVKHNTNLETIYIGQNPVVQFPSYKQELIKLIPTLK